MRARKIRLRFLRAGLSARIDEGLQDLFLDHEGHPPKMSETTKQQIVEAIANDYPGIKNMSDRDQKAVVKWVVNEHDQ